eukprot:gene27484-4792_t
MPSITILAMNLTALCICALLALAVAARTTSHLAGDESSPPRIFKLKTKDRCITLNYTCMKHGNYIIFDKHVVEGSQSGDLVPYFFIAGGIQSHVKHFDPFSAEPTVGTMVDYGRVELEFKQNPPEMFSNATAPVVIYMHQPQDFHKFMARGPALLWHLQQEGAFSATPFLVLALPASVRPSSFHTPLLRAFSSGKVPTLLRFSKRTSGMPHGSETRDPAPDSGEAPERLRCFRQVALCRATDTPMDMYPHMYQAGQHVVQHSRSQLQMQGGSVEGSEAVTPLLLNGASQTEGNEAVPPLLFSGASQTEGTEAGPPLLFSGASKTVGVLIQHLPGGASSIMNAKELAKACNNAKWSLGGTAIECRTHQFGDVRMSRSEISEHSAGARRRLHSNGTSAGAKPNDTTAGAKPKRSQVPWGTAALLNDLSAMQEADVFVAAHNPGIFNAFFMRPATSVIELRPHELGTQHLAYINNALPYALASNK